MTELSLYFLVAVCPVWAQVSPTINPSPSREFGQLALLPSLNSIAPNLVEGRELNEPIALAFDTSTSPPILYIVDNANNRVLAYKNPGSLPICGIGNSKCGFADLQIGQRDFTGTLPGGPGTSGLQAGFASPTGIVVDSKGSVYIADSGNNRIIRFPAPFQQTGTILVPDLVIGQVGLSLNQPNQGQNAPSAQTVSFNGKFVGLAFDLSGNLWVTDPGNNRALRFPVSQLAPNTAQPAADVVLGQTDPSFSTLPNPPAGIQASLDKNILNAPSGIVFDAKGGLYISDGYNRVLYFTGGAFATGLPASRILGLVVEPTPPYPNPNQYGLLGPIGLATNGTNLFVADSGDSRVVEYDVPANWPPEAPLTGPLQPGQVFSPPVIAVIGQINVNGGFPNQNKPQPSASTLYEPFALAFNGTDLWVADTLNNRVLDFPQAGGTGTATATRVIGQSNFQYNAPNLIEGREVFFAGNGATAAAGVVVDQNSNPPHLYIADTHNNRILCFNDARTVTAGSRADLVIGQSNPTDYYDALVNTGTNLASTPTQPGLFGPIGVAVDANGNLFVADTGNGRVLRYPAPFAQTTGQLVPNLILGQQSYTFPDTDATNQTMHSPWGLAIFSEGSIAVSDSFHSRVLIFKKPSGGDFQNGQVASVVLGQPDFNTATPSTAASTAGMNSPRHIAVDTSDRLYVCDSSNNRVLVFTNARNSANGIGSSFQLNNLSAPQGIIISAQTGEIYIANTGANTVLKVPEYDSLIGSSTSNSYPITQSIQLQTPPLSVALYADLADVSDNQIIAETANRITFYFPQLVFENAANYNVQPLAPGMLAIMYRNGIHFNLNTSPTYPNNLALPWPPSVNDLEILVSAPGMAPTPAPIFRIDSTDIAFQVPASTPPSGIATFVLFHPSTGAIVGEGDVQMAQYNPGFFTAGSPVGTGQVRAFNQLNAGETCSPMPDCVINGPSYPVKADGKHYIGFCLTGGGVFANNPPDGQYTAPGSTAAQPQLLSANGGFGTGGLVPPADVSYSGAGCGFPGGWQVNFLVPNTIPPSSSNIIALTIGDIPSSIGPTGIIHVWFASD